MVRPFNIVMGMLLSLILGLNVCFSQEMDWQCDYDKALNDAYMKGDLLLLNFVGKWDPARGIVDDPRTLMEDDIWKDTAVIRLSRKYVCVRLLCYMGSIDLTGGQRYQQLVTRHKVTLFPTTVIIDPLGAEFARIVGFKSNDQMRSILRIHMPDLFQPFQALQKLEHNPDDPNLLIAAGNEYFIAGIAGLSEQYYERGAEADTLTRDPVLREHVGFNRAVNQYRMTNVQASIKKMEKLLDTYPASPERSTYLLWLVKLHAGIQETTRASQYLNILEKESPESEQARSARDLLPR